MKLRFHRPAGITTVLPAVALYLIFSQVMMDWKYNQPHTSSRAHGNIEKAKMTSQFSPARYYLVIYTSDGL